MTVSSSKRSLAWGREPRLTGRSPTVHGLRTRRVNSFYQGKTGRRTPCFYGRRTNSKDFGCDDRRAGFEVARARLDRATDRKKGGTSEHYRHVSSPRSTQSASRCDGLLQLDGDGSPRLLQLFADLFRIRLRQVLLDRHRRTLNELFGIFEIESSNIDHDLRHRDLAATE
jgi:hypothetical protein